MEFALDGRTAKPTTSGRRKPGQDGPDQGMTKLLLAARAEGANSRWPF